MTGLLEYTDGTFIFWPEGDAQVELARDAGFALSTTATSRHGRPVFFTDEKRSGPRSEHT